MASRQMKRTATRTSRTGGHISAVHVDTSDDGETSLSGGQSSPTRLSRLQEKETLSCLNDRLAQYIDKVRQLESENARLTVQIRDVEVVEKRERGDMRARYEAQLTDVRRTLDETAKSHARAQIEAEKAMAEAAELRPKLAKLEKDFKASEMTRLNSESLVQDLQARLNTAENRRKHAEDDAKGLRADNGELERQLNALKRQLENEQLLRVDLENRNQTLNDEQIFNRQLHEKEMEEVRRKRQVEMTTVSRQLETEYQAKLQEQLQAMRADRDARIASNRREIEDLYKNKLADAAENAQRARVTAAEGRDEAARYRHELQQLETNTAGYANQIEALQKKITDLEHSLRGQREEFLARISQRDDQIGDLNAEIGRMIAEYQDLMDLKVQLDAELQAYQKLLEGEEDRLHLTPASSPAQQQVSFSESPSRRGVKRKRVLHESDETYGDIDQHSFKTNAGNEGDVEVEEHDTAGRFIRLHNKGDDEVAVGGWVLKSNANGREVSYKFHVRQAIKPGKTLTVWSSDSGETHAPPSNLVMKNQQWPSGDGLRTQLTDQEGTVTAWRDSVRSSLIGNGEGDADQRCSIM